MSEYPTAETQTQSSYRAQEGGNSLAKAEELARYVQMLREETERYRAYQSTGIPGGDASVRDGERVSRERERYEELLTRTLEDIVRGYGGKIHTVRPELLSFQERSQMTKTGRIPLEDGEAALSEAGRAKLAKFLTNGVTDITLLINANGEAFIWPKHGEYYLQNEKTPRMFVEFLNADRSQAPYIEDADSRVHSPEYARDSERSPSQEVYSSPREELANSIERVKNELERIRAYDKQNTGSSSHPRSVVGKIRALWDQPRQYSNAESGTERAELVRLETAAEFAEWVFGEEATSECVGKSQALEKSPLAEFIADYHSLEEWQKLGIERNAIRGADMSEIRGARLSALATEQNGSHYQGDYEGSDLEAELGALPRESVEETFSDETAVRYIRERIDYVSEDFPHMEKQRVLDFVQTSLREILETEQAMLPLSKWVLEAYMTTPEGEKWLTEQIKHGLAYVSEWEDEDSVPQTVLKLRGYFTPAAFEKQAFSDVTLREIRQAVFGHVSDSYANKALFWDLPAGFFWQSDMQGLYEFLKSETVVSTLAKYLDEA